VRVRTSQTTIGWLHTIEGGSLVPRLLEVKDLRTYFYTPDGVVPAVDGVSLHINSGETLCVVGESGCGKSVTSLSVMKLVPTPPGRYLSGEILFEGTDLIPLSSHAMERIRGKDIAMIFQEPMTALNPVHTIGHQIGEAFTTHEDISRKGALQRAEEMLKLVGVPDPARCARSFPHQLSGGMRQRAMIAMALSCHPKLLIADEPTTALDVTIQAQILDLMKQLKRKTGMALMLITHDLGVVAEMAERVVVMYSGKIVEEAKSEDLFREPLHPYTEGLLSCIPRVDRPQEWLHVISGQVPNPLRFPSGCRFHPRCPYSQAKCRRLEPELAAVGERKMACHFFPQDRMANEVAVS
jgi:oligopeptide/dipeptide ABC transporter ATP-binding protein